MASSNDDILSDREILEWEVRKPFWSYFQNRPFPSSDLVAVDFYIAGETRGYASSASFYNLCGALDRYGAENISSEDNVNSMFTSGGHFAFSITSKTNPELIMDLDKILYKRPPKEDRKKSDKYFLAKISMMAGLGPVNIISQSKGLMKQLRDDCRNMGWETISLEVGKLGAAIDLESSKVPKVFKGDNLPQGSRENFFKLVFQLNKVNYEMSSDNRFIIPNERSLADLRDKNMLPESIIKEMGMEETAAKTSLEK